MGLWRASHTVLTPGKPRNGEANGADLVGGRASQTPGKPGKGKPGAVGGGKPTVGVATAGAVGLAVEAPAVVAAAAAAQQYHQGK